MSVLFLLLLTQSVAQILVKGACAWLGENPGERTRARAREGDTVGANQSLARPTKLQLLGDRHSFGYFYPIVIIDWHFAAPIYGIDTVRDRSMAHRSRNLRNLV